MGEDSLDDPSNDLLELDIKSVLLVDDDADLSQALKAILEANNYLVTTARNGLEALKETMNFDFDIVICDLMMPNMPGDMFYLAVERTKPHLCERFLFVTAHQKEPRIEEFLNRSKGAMLIKPFRADDLVSTLALMLKSRRAAL